MIDMKTLKKLAKQGLSLIGLADSSALAEINALPVVTQPMPSLIKRLNQPEMPNWLSDSEKEEFVLNAIRTVDNGRLAKKISRKTLRRITDHYGVRVPGFRVLSAKRPNMLLVPQPA